MYYKLSYNVYIYIIIIIIYFKYLEKLYCTNFIYFSHRVCMYRPEWNITIILLSFDQYKYLMFYFIIL